MPTFWAREDSGTANNPALNLTGAPAVEITFVPETPSGGAGDLILDQPGGGAIDPDTQVLINGTTYSFTFEFSGTLPTQNNQGAGQVPDQFEGNSVYVITVVDYPTAGDTTRLTFLPDDAATQVEMDAFGNGRIDVQNLDTTPPPSPVCFAVGTRILTPHGEKCIEDIKVGDLVITKDDGAQPVRWISTTKLVWPGSDEKHKPILIKAHALGAGKPHRDLVVSPQHKILLEGLSALGDHNSSGRLAPAKGMVDFPGVRKMAGKRQVTYVHLMLDRHSILTSEGLESETFYPGPTALTMLTAAQRSAIHALFPALHNDPENGYGPQARKCLSYRQTKELAAQLCSLDGPKSVRRRDSNDGMNPIAEVDRDTCAETVIFAP